MNTILFDLDGTLLQMNQDSFIAAYFSELAKSAAKFGYDPKEVTKATYAGTIAMAKNDGGATNEAIFWQTFHDILGEKALADKDKFIDFYKTDFVNVAVVSKKNELSDKIVKRLKEKGYRLALATMPMFPKEGTEERMRWAGIDKADFDLITTYEDCHSTKPHSAYYRQVLDKLGVTPKDCMMVGNNVDEDMCVTKLGIDTFLVTDCLINEQNKDISVYRQGSLADFYDYVETLPDIRQ